MIDSAILLALTIFILRGAWAGDTAELRSCLAWLLSLAAAAVYYPLLADSTAMLVSLESRHILAFTACCAIAFPIVYFLVSYVCERFSHHKEPHLMNRVLGAGFALLRGVAIVVCLSSVLAQLPIKSAKLDRSIIVRSMSLF